MADQFRADGLNENQIEKFIREEMEHDEFVKGEGTTDINAYKEWKSWPEERRELYLNNAFCSNCGVASFAPDYSIRKDRYGVLVEGHCSKCGAKICRVCD